MYGVLSFNVSCYLDINVFVMVGMNCEGEGDVVGSCLI